MIPAQHEEMAEWAATVYRRARQYADELDPTRRDPSEAAYAFANIAAAAKWAHWYLVGHHLEDAASR